MKPIPAARRPAPPSMKSLAAMAILALGCGAAQADRVRSS